MSIDMRTEDVKIELNKLKGLHALLDGYDHGLELEPEEIFGINGLFGDAIETLENKFNKLVEDLGK